MSSRKGRASADRPRSRSGDGYAQKTLPPPSVRSGRETCYIRNCWASPGRPYRLRGLSPGHHCRSEPKRHKRRKKRTSAGTDLAARMFPSHLMRRKPDGIRSGLILRQIILFHSGNTVLVRPVIDRRSRLEISVWRRRRNCPFKRGGFPGIYRCLGSFEHTVKKIDQKWDCRQSQRECAERYKNVNRLLTTKMLVLSWIGDSAHHPIQPEVMHWEKRAIEEDECESKMNLAPSLIHHPPEHFREPKINRPEDAEEAATEENIMDMSNDEVGMMDEQIDGSRCHIDPAQSANHEHGDETQGKTHRGREPYRAAPNSPHPIERLNGGRHRDHHC